MSSKAEVTSTGMFTLLIVFIILKLTNIVDWSWWLVISPIWIPFSVAIAVSTIAFIIRFLIETLDSLK